MKRTVRGLLAAGAAAEAASEAAGAAGASDFLLQPMNEANVSTSAKLEINARREPAVGPAEETLCMTVSFLSQSFSPFSRVRRRGTPASRRGGLAVAY